MSDTPHTGPVPLPAGTTITAASGKSLTLRAQQPLAVGSILEFDLLLGARPIQAMARIVASRGAEASSGHIVEVALLAMAQVDRDNLADFIQAVGVGALRVREHKED